MKVIKSIQVTWNWTGDANLIKAFNVAVTTTTENPNTELVVSTTVGKDPRSYTFKDVTLDDSVTYTAWVQAVYAGKDSDWVSAGDLVVSDDGTASITTNDVLEARAAQAENTAASYTDTAVAGIDVSSDINANNDIIAQNLGYIDYAALQAAAIGGTTIINGGHLNTTLIEAEAISASMLSTEELITYTAQIGNGIITAAKIGAAEIGSAHIGTSVIATSHIGDLQVETAKIRDNAITFPILNKYAYAVVYDADVNIHYTEMQDKIWRFDLCSFYADTYINQPYILFGTIGAVCNVRASTNDGGWARSWYELYQNDILVGTGFAPDSSSTDYIEVVNYTHTGSYQSHIAASDISGEFRKVFTANETNEASQLTIKVCVQFHMNDPNDVSYTVSNLPLYSNGAWQIDRLPGTLFTLVCKK